MREPLAVGPQADPDVQLMLRLRDGDDSAFSELLARNHKRVLNLAFRYLGDRSLAEDVAQDTFLKLYRARKRYQPQARFHSYLLRIAANLCLSRLRKKTPTFFAIGGGGADDGPSIGDPGETPRRDSLLQKELEERIQVALGKLPPRQRMAILLNKFEGLDYKEVATKLDLSVAATKSLLHRARMALKDELQPYLGAR